MWHLIVISTTIIMLISQHLAQGQTRGFKDTVQAQVVGAKMHPDLATEYQRGVSFKLISRKRIYRIGEMINLDVAMLNESGEPAFFLNLANAYVQMRDKAGRSMQMVDYLSTSEATTPESYTLVQPNRVIFESFELLVGCDSRAMAQFGRIFKESESEAFEHNLFVNWGRGCLNIRHPGTYFITVKQSNNYVLVSPQGAKVKTVVGETQSLPLTITVTR